MNRKERRRLASKKLYSEHAAVRAIFEKFEAAGLIVRTGKMRPSPRTGELLPVFVVAPKYADDREAFDKALALLHETAGNG
jgi:hypothetical protein